MVSPDFSDFQGRDALISNGIENLFEESVQRISNEKLQQTP